MNEIPWSRGRLRGRGGPRVVFGFQHEASEVELAALIASGGGRALCIASGGEVAFALLGGGAEEVMAVDVNPAQLHLVELKRAAIRSGRADWMQGDASEAIAVGGLPDETLQYWRRHRTSLRSGLCFSGIVERRTYLLGPALRWFARDPRGIRWRIGCALLKGFVGVAYAARYRRHLPPGWCDRLCERIATGSRSENAHPLWLAELGLGFGKSGLADYEAEKLERIVPRLERLKLVSGEITAILQDEKEEPWSLIALSNIADTLDSASRNEVLRLAAKRLKTGGSLVIRSIVSPPGSLPSIPGLEWMPLPSEAGPICPVIGIGRICGRV